MNISHGKKTFKLAVLPLALAASFSSASYAGTGQVRVVWDQDPARSAVIGFSPVGQSANAYVMYGSDTNEASWTKKSVTSSYSFDAGFDSEFVRLSNLTPDSKVFFKVCDDSGCGSLYNFKTAPASSSDFTFIAGGDSRSNPSVRRSGNKLVAKSRPLFVMFGGDLTYGNEAHEISSWLDDWQYSFTSDVIDGKNYKTVYPLIPAVGNHEKYDQTFMCKVFGIDSNNDGRCSLDDTYFAVSLGGNQMRIYTLNTEFRNSGYSTEWSRQKSWLSSDLSSKGASATWRVGQYHKPMFPRTTSKSYVNSKMFEWANDFYNKKMNLVVESDSHLVKYSWPVKPASNDMQKVNAGTVFIGEGSWGAPTRPADRYSDWIADQSSFAQFKIVQLKGEQMLVRTARFSSNAQTLPLASRDADPLALPSGLSIWNAASVGQVYTLAKDSSGRTMVATGAVDLAANFSNSCQDLACSFDASASTGEQLSYSWSFGDGSSGTGQQADHSYAAAGSYSVKLTVTDKAGKTQTQTQTVTVKKTDPADFVLTNKVAKTGLAGAKASSQYFTYQSTSTGNLQIATSGGTGDVDLFVKFGSKPTSNSYDCRPYKNGNGETCDFAAAKVGTYHVMLNGYQDYSGVTLKVTAADGASNQQPTAKFTTSKTGLNVSFADASQDPDGQIQQRAWDFGDGASSSQTNPSHTYSKAGSYQVVLTVTDNDGATASQTQTVTVTATNTGGGDAAPWSADKVYVAQSLVTHKGNTYQAQWWNQGNEPGASQWGPWQLVTGGTTPTPTPNPSPAPTVAPTVQPSVTPTDGPVAGCGSVAPWNTNTSYVIGDEVSYNNQLWRATWYNANLAPGSSNAWSSWELVSDCN